MKFRDFIKESKDCVKKLKAGEPFVLIGSYPDEKTKQDRLVWGHQDLKDCFVSALATGDAIFPQAKEESRDVFKRKDFKFKDSQKKRTYQG